MLKATELLKLTSLSIAEIGSAVGYENQLHFRAHSKESMVSHQESGETAKKGEYTCFPINMILLLKFLALPIAKARGFLFLPLLH